MDKRIQKWLDIIGCYELEERIEGILGDENTLDGRTEMQVFADELSYCISCYNEDGHCWHDDLVQARELLRETKNGTKIPLDSRTLKPKQGYRPYDIDTAKRIVEEYKRMVYRYNQLKRAGVYGKWWD